MDLITLDMETYYDKDYSLSKMTTEEYIRDPRFEVVGVSVKVNNGETEWASGTMGQIKKYLHRFDWANSMLLAHNTMFDGAILSWHFDVHPKALADTMHMARALHGVESSASLKAVAQRYGVGVKGTEVVRAMGKRRLDFTPEELSTYGDYCINDVDLTYSLFRTMSKKFPMKELKLIDLTLRMFTEPTLELDIERLEDHLEGVKARKEQLLTEAGVEDKGDLMSNQKFAEMLKGFGVEPPTKISPTTGKETFAFAKNDEEFKALLEHDDDRVQALVAARLGTKSTLEETRTQRFIDIATRGKLPVPVRYYAAHTGRWGGDDKINLQNLPSRGPNAKALKKAIIAPEGHTIVEADSAQIEARVLAWLAEQEDLVSAFTNREDVYKKMASSIYGVPIEDVTKDQRFVGKTTILGAGYGMGAVKFQAQLKTFGVDVELEEARRIIGIYRDTNWHISQLWRSAQNMIRYMAQGDRLDFGRAGVLRVDPSQKAVILPSGLPMYYHDLFAVEEEKGPQYYYKVRSGDNKIYGGKCLAGGTEVLTDKGWVPLRDVTRAHRVWDGVKWVKHDGLIYQGKKVTTVVNGVRMTPDHNILTERGWRCASSSEGLHRAGFWLPDGSEVSGDKWPMLGVDLPVQLRNGSFSGGYRRGKVCPTWWAPVVRLQGWGRQQIARYVEASGVLGMEVYAGPLPPAYAPSMAQLRGTRYQSMPSVGAVIRGVLGGHGADIPAGADTGQEGQQRGLYSGKLSLGDTHRTGEEPAEFATSGHNQGAQADGRFEIDPTVSVAPEPVYDLLNAGPDARFVVRGSTGPFIVHNCVENVCQGIARCIIGEQMLRIAKRYKVVLTVHDSIVCCVPDAEVVDAVAYVEESMRWTPDWAAGLPVDCEAGTAKSYGECE